MFKLELQGKKAATCLVCDKMIKEGQRIMVLTD